MKNSICVTWTHSRMAPGITTWSGLGKSFAIGARFGSMTLFGSIKEGWGRNLSPFCGNFVPGVGLLNTPDRSAARRGGQAGGYFL